MSNANSQFTPFGAGELNIRILDVDAPAAVSISAAFKWKDKQWKKQTTDRPASSEEKQHFSIILWRNKSTNLSSNYIPYTCFITILVETQQKYFLFVRYSGCTSAGCSSLLSAPKRNWLLSHCLKFTETVHFLACRANSRTWMPSL